MRDLLNEPLKTRIGAQTLSVCAIRTLGGDSVVAEISDLDRLETVRIENLEGYDLLFFRSATQAVKVGLSLVITGNSRFAAGVITADIDFLNPVSEYRKLVIGVADLAEPGQLLVSMATQELARQFLIEGQTFSDLGTRQLGGQAIRLFMLNVGEGEQRLNQVRNGTGLKSERFVGRFSEIEALKKELFVSKLVSVHGRSGIGKSSLVSRTATEIEEQYVDGLLWVDLAKVRRTSLFVHHMATALDIVYCAESTLLDQIMRRIGAGSYLLVLDDVDFLEDVVCQVAETLIDACPNLTIVCTSVKRLQSQSSSPFLLDGLECPLPVEPRENIERYDAINLFTDLATRISPSFELNLGNVNDIVQIVNRVEGSPWMIGMVVSRLGLLSPHQILTRLKDDPLAFLVDKEKPADSVTSVFVTMVKTLSPFAQTLFARLWIFEGLFTVESVQGVCGDGALRADSIFACLKELQEGQFLRPVYLGESKRCFMLGAVTKEFSKGSCSVAERKSLKNRMTRYLDQRGLILFGEGLTSENRGLEEFETLYEDLLLRWIEGSQTHAGLIESINQIVLCSNYWLQRRYYREALSLIVPLSTLPKASAAPKFLNLLNMIVWCSLKNEDYQRARVILKAALRISLQTGSGIQTSRLLNTGVSLSSNLDKPRTALKLARSLFQYVDNGSEDYWSSLSTLGAAYLGVSKFEECERVLHQFSLQDIDSDWGSIVYYNNLAMAEACQGKGKQARMTLLTACDRHETFPYQESLPSSYLIGCRLFIEEGSMFSAAILLQGALEVSEHYGLPISPKRARLVKWYHEVVGGNPGAIRSGWSPQDPLALLRSAISSGN